MNFKGAEMKTYLNTLYKTESFNYFDKSTSTDNFVVKLSKVDNCQLTVLRWSLEGRNVEPLAQTQEHAAVE